MAAQVVIRAAAGDGSVRLPGAAPSSLRADYASMAAVAIGAYKHVCGRESRAGRERTVSAHFADGAREALGRSAPSPSRSVVAAGAGFGC